MPLASTIYKHFSLLMPLHFQEVASLNTEDCLAQSHRHLLQIGSMLQLSFNSLPSWDHNEKLSKASAEARKELDSVLTDHFLTDSQLRRILILKSVHSELFNAAENHVSDLDRLLSYRKNLPASPNLLLVKKWGDFFTRTQKNNPNYPK